MVKLRLARLGRKNRPFYRIVAVDSREKRDGRYLENLGWYDPLQKESSKKVNLETERYKHWLSVGAQPSDTLNVLLKHTKVIEAPTAPSAAKKPRRRPGSAKKAGAPGKAKSKGKAKS
jgi:small subunit ribosomal protein S16